MLSVLEQPTRAGLHPFHYLNDLAVKHPNLRKTGLWLRFLLPLAIAPGLMATLFLVSPGVSTFAGLLMYIAAGSVGGEAAAQVMRAGLKMAKEEAYSAKLEEKLTDAVRTRDEATSKAEALEAALHETEFLKKVFGSELRFGGKDGRKYVITKLLGFGGMAAVFEAYDTALQRKVAVKIPLPTTVHDPRFSVAEIKNQATIRHPRVVAVDASEQMPKSIYERVLRTKMGEHLQEIRQKKGQFNYPGGETDNENRASYFAETSWDVSAEFIPFMVMEYVEGKTIEDLLQGNNNNPLPLKHSLKWIFDTAQTLWALRMKKGIIHRDLKPSNLFVVPGGELGTVKVADFGISKKLSDRVGMKHSPDGLTRTGETPGTPGYMPYEQLCGDDPKIDERVDVHSLGVTLYEMLTRRLPYRLPTGRTVKEAENLLRVRTILAMGKQQPSSPNEGYPPERKPVPDDVAAVIMKAIAKEPENRYPTWREFCQDLLNLCRRHNVPISIDEELVSKLREDDKQ